MEDQPNAMATSGALQPGVRGRRLSPKILDMSSLGNRRSSAPSTVLAGDAFHPQPGQDSQGGQAAASLVEERV
jgi:hypothetical protein